MGRAAVASARESGANIIAAWRTNNRATVYLIEHFPAELWSHPVPGAPRRTVGMIAAHIHNARCWWIRALGSRHGVPVPKPVDPRRTSLRELVRALSKSSQGIVRLIDLGVARGGTVPRATWQNFPTDLPHFLSYFVAHEAHHRGQLCLLARQLGKRLPRQVAGGIWQWTRLSRRGAGL